jgi:predicted secreted protein
MTEAGRDSASRLPSRITLPRGEVSRLPLPSAAGAGYSWEVVALEGEDVASVTIEVGAVPPQSEPPANVQAPVALAVRPLKQGKGRWRLRLERPWERQSPLESHELEVEVRPVDGRE